MTDEVTDEPVDPVQLSDLPSELLLNILSNLSLQQILDHELYLVCKKWNDTIPLCRNVTTLTFTVEYSAQSYQLMVETNCNNCTDDLLLMRGNGTKKKLAMLLQIYCQKVENIIINLANFPNLTLDNFRFAIDFQKYLMDTLAKLTCCHNSLRSLTLHTHAEHEDQMNPENFTLHNLDLNCNDFVVNMLTIPHLNTLTLGPQWLKVVQTHSLQVQSLTELNLQLEEVNWCHPTQILYSFIHNLPPLLERLYVGHYADYATLNVFFFEQTQMKSVTYPNMTALNINGKLFTEAQFLKPIIGCFPNLKGLRLKRIHYGYVSENETYSFMSLVKHCPSLTFLDVSDVVNSGRLRWRDRNIEKVEWPADGRPLLHIVNSQSDMNHNHPSKAIVGNVNILVEHTDIDRERENFYQQWKPTPWYGI